MLALRLWLAVAIVAIAFAVIPLSAVADDRTDCNSHNTRTIRGCTALIKSGQYDPGATALAYYNRGIAYSNQGDLDTALKDYGKAIALNSRDARFFYNRGTIYYHKLDYDRAIDDFDTALALDPKKTEAHYNRGLAYLDKGDFDQSIKSFDKAIALDPKDSDAYYNRGTAQARKGNNTSAVKDFDKVIALSPRDALAYGKRASAYQKLGKYELAVTDYRKSLSIEPNGALSKNIKKLLAFSEEKLRGTSQTPAASDHKFKFYQNTDLVGPLIGKVSSGSAVECERACNNDQKCKAYSFNIWNSLCFLKGKPTLRLLEPSSISGLKSKAEPPPKSDAAIAMVRYRGKAFPGKSFKSSPANGFELCEGGCQNSETCIAFSFVKADSTCKLFDKVGEYSSRDGVDSGVKRQSVN